MTTAANPRASKLIKLTFADATPADAAAIAALRLAAGQRLTLEFGHGPWSGGLTERGVLYDLRHSRVLIARKGLEIVGSLSLVKKKPWAIDTAYFTKVESPVYLINMAVAPALQRQGIGRRLLDHARAIAREMRHEAIRLDAYDAAAGAPGFYAKCGFREVGRVTYKNVPLVYFESLLANDP